MLSQMPFVLISCIAYSSTLVGNVRRLAQTLYDMGTDLSEQLVCDIPNLIASDRWQGTFLAAESMWYGENVTTQAMQG